MAAQTVAVAVAQPVATPDIRPAILASRLVAWLAASLFATVWFTDPDLWGHLRFGLDAIRDGSLTRVDPYSFTSDVPWINHEWLSEVLLGLAYSAGIPGLQALKLAVLGSAYTLWAWKLRETAVPVRWWILATVIVTSAPIAMTWRPQLWTLLLLSIVLATLHWPLRRQFLLWPAMFAFWANLHGGWIVGLGVIGAWGIGVGLDARDWRRVVPLAGLGFTCLAATLLTPYGFELWTFLVRTVGVDRSDIIEWRHVWSDGIPLIWLLTVAMTAVLFWRTRWSWAPALPVLMLAVMSARVSRLGGLFAIVAGLLLAPRWKGEAAPDFPKPLLGMLGFAAVIPLAFFSYSQSQCLSPIKRRPPDVAAAGALMAPEVQGKLMVPFNWGQFALWHFSPRLKVSFDGRRETVYSQARIDEQHGLTSGDLRIAPFIAQHQPEYVWLTKPEGDMLSAHLTANGYRQDISTAQSAILTRRDLSALTARPMSGCFP